MKKYSFHILGLLLALFALQSCSEDEFMRYDTARASLCFPRDDNGAVPYGDQYIKTVKDTDTFTFSIMPATVTSYDINVPVQVTGIPEPADRQFAITIVDSLTTAVAGTDYVALPADLTMPADSTTTHVTLTLLRSADLQQSERVITLRLLPSADFPDAVITEKSTVMLKFGDIITEPSWWASWSKVLGRWSRVKYQKWLEIYGNEDLPDVSGQMVMSYQYLKEALATQKL